MADREVWGRMIQVMREVFDDDSLELTPDSTARNVEGWDSISHIEMIIALENAFGIRFRTGEIAGLNTVGELAEVIDRRRPHVNQ